MSTAFGEMADLGPSDVPMTLETAMRSASMKDGGAHVASSSSVERYVGLQYNISPVQYEAKPHGRSERPSRRANKSNEP